MLTVGLIARDVRSRESARAHVPRAPVGRAERVDADDAGGVGGVNELIAADRDSDVGGAIPPFGGEEEQITRFDLRRSDFVAGFILLFNDARYDDAVLGEHVLYESAAIKT